MGLASDGPDASHEEAAVGRGSAMQMLGKASCCSVSTREADYKAGTRLTLPGRLTTAAGRAPGVGGRSPAGKPVVASTFKFSASSRFTVSG